MGHIPGFTAAIFPSAAMPNLTFVANLGLIRNGWIGSGFAVTGASASAQTSRKPRSYPTSVMRQPRNAGDLIVLGRNIATLVAFEAELSRTSDDATRGLGALGAAAARSGLQASVIVVRAGDNHGLR